MRLEFTKTTKREALSRSKGFCEATGRFYGFKPGERCNAPLAYGVEFDHYPVRAADGGSNLLENCSAVCVRCHRWKTGNVDIPGLAKSKRISDKRRGISKPRSVFETAREGRFKRRLDGRVVLR